ncbi:hypothetical protein JCM6882_005297 [Rhodosporidiobolus microsporus]
MLTTVHVPAVPVEGARRKVLVSSSSSSFNNSSPTASYPSSRPIRAKVDLAAVSSPPSPSWSPSQPIRARVVGANGGGAAPRSGGYNSAPTTPLGSSTPFARGGGTPVQAAAPPRARLSPTLGSSTRGPSPSRPRSPEGAGAARTTPTARTGPRVVGTPNYGGEPGLLRGQSDPFPSTPSSVGTATPISHLPSSVSVRKIHSPSLRASPSVGASLSASHNGDISSSTSSLPTLSTSPGSVASSPLTSPGLHAYSSDRPSSSLSAGFPDGSVGKRAGAGIRRTSGVSSVSSMSSCDVSSTNGGLLPPLSIASEISNLQRSHSPTAIPLQSPPLQPIPIHATPSIGTTRSPTLPSFPSSRNLKATVSPGVSGSSTPQSRPPLSSTNSANRRRHARSNSITSTSSRSSAFSAHDDHPPPREPAASWGAARAASSVGRSRPVSPSSPGAGASTARAPLSAVDWSAFAAIADAEEAAAALLSGGGGVYGGGGSGRASSGSEVSGLSADGGRAGTAVPASPRVAPGSPKKEVDEKEKEARVERKIADLEITNSSLLQINASLERLKLKHTSEIRELRRRLRESVGGAGLAALRAQAAALDEGESSDPDGDGDGADGSSGDEDATPEPTWQELLDGDEHFSAVATTLESLVRRAKTALEYVPAAHEGGRVLSTVEQEDRQLEVEMVDREVMTDLSAVSTPVVASAGRNARGLGISGWQQQRGR